MDPSVLSTECQTDIMPYWQINEEILSSTIEYFQSKERVGELIIPNSVIESLKLISFFIRNCPKEKELKQFIVEALNHMSYEKYHFGQVLINLGEYGDKAYIILSGQVGVYMPRRQEEIDKELSQAVKKAQYMFQRLKTQEEQQIEDPALKKQIKNETYWSNGVPLFEKVHQYYSGDHFGEVSLDGNQPRSASIIVQSLHLHCLTIKKKGYRQVLQKTLDEVMNILDFFLKIFPETLVFSVSKFVKHLDTITFSSQQILWQKNSTPEYFFFIVSGRIELFYHVDSNEEKRKASSPNIFQVNLKQVAVGQFTAGNIIGLGEILFNQCKRKYYCKSLERTFGYYITKHEYDKIRDQYQEIEQHLFLIESQMQQAITEREQTVNRALIDYQNELNQLSRSKSSQPQYKDEAELISQLRKIPLVRSKNKNPQPSNYPIKKLISHPPTTERDVREKQIQQILYPQLKEQVIKCLHRNIMLQRRQNNDKLQRAGSANLITIFSQKQSKSIEKYIIKQEDKTLLAVKSYKQLNCDLSFSPRQIMLKARSQSKANLTNQIFKTKISRVLSNCENIKTESTFEEYTIHNSNRHSPQLNFPKSNASKSNL